MCIYRGILFSLKEVKYCHLQKHDASWEYHAKGHKLDIKGQQPYDFRHMCDIKWKATKEQTRQINKNLYTQTTVLICTVIFYRNF